MNSAQLNKDIVKDIWRKTTLHRETRGHTHRASFPYMRWEEVWASLLFIEQLPYQEAKMWTDKPTICAPMFYVVQDRLSGRLLNGV